MTKRFKNIAAQIRWKFISLSPIRWADRSFSQVHSETQIPSILFLHPVRCFPFFIVKAYSAPSLHSSLWERPKKEKEDINEITQVGYISSAHIPSHMATALCKRSSEM